MGSTEYSIGLSEEKSSSRVLKPPGGGHSDIFGTPEVKANPPRPKYNQQNSSNMNCVMGTADPNLKPQQESVQAAAPDGPKAAGQPSAAAAPASANQSDQASGRSRVPPGGFSSGLW